MEGKRHRGTGIGKEREGNRQERRERRRRGKEVASGQLVFTSFKGQKYKFLSLSFLHQTHPLGPTGPKGRQILTNLKFLFLYNFIHKL
jgi:hypothetical protein